MVPSSRCPNRRRTNRDARQPSIAEAPSRFIGGRNDVKDGFGSRASGRNGVGFPLPLHNRRLGAAGGSRIVLPCLGAPRWTCTATLHIVAPAAGKDVPFCCTLDGHPASQRQ